jgi:hypothetical protein
MRNIRNWYKLLEGSGLVANDSGPGAAQGALSANVTWLPFYSPPFSDLQLTGTLSPDASGTYTLKYIYNSQPTFALSTTWFLWWDPADQTWYISEIRGTVGARGWYNESTQTLGTYEPYGTATGTAQLTCGYTFPYDQKGVIIAASQSRITSAAAAGFPSAAGSIEMLCRPSWNYNDGIGHFFWDTYGGSNRRFFLYKYTDNTTLLWTDNTSRGSFTFAWAAGTLYHIVLNWGTNQLYVNGVLVKDYTDGTLGLGSSTLYIGDQYTGSNYSFNGMIYYFIARDVALTLAEITAFNAFFQNLYIPQPT